LLIPSAPSTPEEAQAYLVLAMAVASHPWLFGVAKPQALESPLALLLQAVPQPAGTEQPYERWQKLLALGRTLVRLEECFERQTIAEWNRQTDWKELGAGELVWQGPAVGYLVTLAPCTRTSGNVLCASAESRALTRNIRSSYLNPVRALVELAPVRSRLDEMDMASVVDMLTSLRKIVRPPKL
jgi:hypothetical protein